MISEIYSESTKTHQKDVMIDNDLFKVNTENILLIYRLYSNSTIKTTEQRH